MADLKISQLAGATTPLAGTEVLPIVQGGATKQVSVANLTAGRTQTSNGIVQGSAATGYNFTANTPAAGMTSQLLNWYEEGTWTPTRNGFTEVLGGGTITTTGTYTRVGRVVTATAQIIASGGATIAATGGAVSYLSGLPYATSVFCAGSWINSSTIAASGGIFVSSTNLFVVTGWAAAGNGYTFTATYIV